MKTSKYIFNHILFVFQPEVFIFPIALYIDKTAIELVFLWFSIVFYFDYQPNYNYDDIDYKTKTWDEGDDKTRIIFYIEGEEDWVANCAVKQHRGEISEVFVNEKYRRRGIGFDLIQTAIAYGGTYLKVYKDNKPAIKLYKHSGFKICKKDSTFYYMILKRRG